MTLLSGVLFASLVLTVGGWLLRGLFWWAVRPHPWFGGWFGRPLMWGGPWRGSYGYGRPPRGPHPVGPGMGGMPGAGGPGMGGPRP